MELQPNKPVSDDYVVTNDDLGWVLLASGDVVFPGILQTGFYATVINDRGGTVGILTPGTTLRSPSGGAALTAINSSTTVLKLPGNTWFAFGI